MNFEQAIRQLQDTLIVMTEIQSRQAEVQKMQTEEVALHSDFIRSLKKSRAEHEERMRHIELTLSEIGDKLNGLIGFMDGFFRRPQ